MASRLVRHLVSLVEREDRGALASLRRGLGKEPGEAPGMFPIVERFLPENASQALVEAAYLVASLFGFHPCHREAAPGSRPWDRSFGHSLRAIRFDDGGEENDGVSRRFVALLNCDREALPTHLRHLVQLLKAKKQEAPIDFVQLFYDILDWENVERKVQRNWAAGFWGGAATNGEDEPAGDSPDAGDNSDSGDTND